MGGARGRHTWRSKHRRLSRVGRLPPPRRSPWRRRWATAPSAVFTRITHVGGRMHGRGRAGAHAPLGWSTPADGARLPRERRRRPPPISHHWRRPHSAGRPWPAGIAIHMRWHVARPPRHSAPAVAVPAGEGARGEAWRARAPNGGPRGSSTTNRGHARGGTCDPSLPAVRWGGAKRWSAGSFLPGGRNCRAARDVRRPLRSGGGRAWRAASPCFVHLPVFCLSQRRHAGGGPRPSHPPRE